MIKILLLYASPQTFQGVLQEMDKLQLVQKMPPSGELSLLVSPDFVMTLIRTVCLKQAPGEDGDQPTISVRPYLYQLHLWLLLERCGKLILRNGQAKRVVEVAGNQLITNATFAMVLMVQKSVLVTTKKESKERS
mmetsp:Transcript_30493/g.46735  ORF Transcript_30493/g.46735 Transcript_30493/m.46735 type:complete len:135 (-) Transcript_30493:416-820(-)|eukprot:CAMPEP_0170509854 /NCGR_PEP_ID=MMETSP0208-20121228/65441_1 /TAXON_ID=197538 /ORGANISM="Strombidium inclinatum, Strain S3" /LENGTH=134 /DNA_ID=CAMNT_0010793253 /DNA_START=2724 /DNA_END=3128 /DNA_ORIENTATION=+